MFLTPEELEERVKEEEDCDLDPDYNPDSDDEDDEDVDDDSDGEELPANFSLEVASDKSLLAAAAGKVMEIIDNEQRAVQLGDFKLAKRIASQYATEGSGLDPVFSTESTSLRGRKRKALLSNLSGADQRTAPAPKPASKKKDNQKAAPKPAKKPTKRDKKQVDPSSNKAPKNSQKPSKKQLTPAKKKAAVLSKKPKTPN